MSASAKKIADILGGKQLLGRQVSSMHDLDEVVRGGMPKQALDRLLKVLSETESGSDSLIQLRNTIIPRATYQRAHVLNTQVSETTERLARICVQAPLSL